MWQRVFAFLDRGSGGDGQWKGHTNEQPPTGKIIPPSMFTAQGLYCVRLRFTLNILGMCACGTFYPWEEVLCGGLEMLWKKRRCVRVCVCALSRRTYSRSGCLSELRPDRCGSNLRPYDVIDYLIFWRPTHRPPLGLMDTHTKTHRTTVSSSKHKNKSRLVLLGTRLDSLSNRVRKDDGSRKCSLIPSFMCEMLICVCCFLKLAFPRSSGCAIFLSVLPPLMSACVLM